MIQKVLLTSLPWSIFALFRKVTGSSRRPYCAISVATSTGIPALFDGHTKHLHALEIVLLSVWLPLGSMYPEEWPGYQGNQLQMSPQSSIEQKDIVATITTVL